MEVSVVVVDFRACNKSEPRCFVHSIGEELKSKNALRTVDSQSHPDSDGGSFPPISTKTQPPVRVVLCFRWRWSNSACALLRGEMHPKGISILKCKTRSDSDYVFHSQGAVLAVIKN